ncbi:HAD-IA family hydrolase [Thioclava sp. GXIMD2076]|uniref:HAD family hydrolase n=1 Tax=unclassified Thioclava TaxID=2621713 RepID=UPI0030D21488
MRCLMLDVDGVIVTHRKGGAWTDGLAQDMGIHPDRLKALLFRQHWEDIVTGRADLHEVLEAVLPHLTRSPDARAFMEYWFSHDTYLDQAVLAACDTLRRRGCRIYLATNQEHHRARHLMHDKGLADHVDGMVYSAALGLRKPEAGFFSLAAQQVGCPPDGLLLVDDTRANVTAARRAGWKACHWRPDRDLVTLVENAD